MYNVDLDKQIFIVLFVRSHKSKRERERERELAQKSIICLTFRYDKILHKKSKYIGHMLKCQVYVLPFIVHTVAITCIPTYTHRLVTDSFALLAIDSIRLFPPPPYPPFLFVGVWIFLWFSLFAHNNISHFYLQQSLYWLVMYLRTWHRHTNPKHSGRMTKKKTERKPTKHTAPHDQRHILRIHTRHISTALIWIAKSMCIFLVRLVFNAIIAAIIII